MALYDLRDDRWTPGHPDAMPWAGHEAAYLLGLDALRISCGHPTRSFPAEQVMLWLKIRLAQLADG